MGLRRFEQVTWSIACDDCGLSSTGQKNSEIEARYAATVLGMTFSPSYQRGGGWLCISCQPPKEPTDWDAHTTLHGTPVGEHMEIGPSGMQKDYIVLTAEERARGFIRPVRRSYRHDKCGGVTTMGLALCETYAREPRFYSGTFCAICKAHFPVGENGEFTWTEDGERVGT